MSVELLSYAQFALSAAFLAGGVFFVLAGAAGVLRLPDFYTRMHAAGMTDTLGAELIILGLIVQAGFSQTSFKLAMIAFLLFLTSPTATHAVVSAAYHAGLKPLRGKYRVPAPEEIAADRADAKVKAATKIGSKNKSKANIKKKAN